VKRVITGTVALAVAFASLAFTASPTPEGKLTFASTSPPTVSLNPAVGPPSSKVAVSGRHFGAYEAVDVYFDTTDEKLATANGTGSFTTTIHIPASATPGTHWFTAIGRHSGLAAQTVFTVQTNWAQYRDDPAHTGFNGFENVLGPSNVSGLTLAWTATTGGAITSSPAVVNGVAYVGSNDGKLYAFPTSCNGTCSPLWTGITGGSIGRSSPAVANGVVYIGSEDGKLYAFSTACRGTCPPLWTGSIGTSTDSSPTVANGVVYIGSTTKLYAFPASCSGTCSPLWTGVTGGYTWDPTVANKLVYVGLDYFAATCKGSCAPLGHGNQGTNWTTSPAAANGLVYYGFDSGNNGVAVKAFPKTCSGACAPVWVNWIGVESYVQGAPAVANGVVYFGSTDGTLYVLSASLVELWEGYTAGSIYSSPAVANGVVYVGSDDDNVYAFPASCSTPCSPLWTGLTGGPVDSSPAVANGVVYVGSGDGKLYAYSLGMVAGPARPFPYGLHPNYSLKVSA